MGTKKKIPAETPLKIVLALGVLGIFVSLYMVKDHYSAQKSICDLSNHLSCSIINKSSYSKLFSVPVGLFGFVWYVVLISFTLKILQNPADTIYWVAAHLAWSVVGVLFCFYFIYAEAMLGAVCLFCTVVHVTCFSVLALSYRIFRQQKAPPPSFLGLVVYFFQEEFSWVLAIALLNLAPVVFFNLPQPEKPVMLPTVQMDPFAKCLSEAGVTMYGSNSCAFCSHQKDLFGASFQYVSYVDCGVEEIKCFDKNVEALPTWIHEGKDGKEIKRHTGLLTVKELKDFSSCK